MDKLKQKLAAFMSGRYGMDDLNKGLVGLYIVILLVNMGLRSQILSALIWPIMIYAIYRSYSRNVAARSAENEKYLALTKPVRRRLSLARRSITGFKRYRYRLCPRCKATIELPARKGSRSITCPKCRTEFEVRIRV
ncbi:MAG TPA: hypothetical protein P5298_14110 [Spirochaetia bacterium]|mgnify:FL=1|nr:hypothetical protein [Spirochaetia bacterium]